MSPVDRGDKYGLVSRLLHWSLALLIFSMAALGAWMVEAGYYARWYLMALNAHKTLGLMSLAVALLLITWRMIVASPAPLHGLSVAESRAARWVQTGGENKNMFDPFSPQSEEERTRIDNIVSVIHDNFQEAVRQGRGDRLTAHPDIFSGAIFVGEHNVRLGLADGLGDTGYVARDVIGVDYTISYTPRDWTDEIFSHFSRGVTQVLFQQRLIL